jgi:hypothetical protein
LGPRGWRKEPRQRHHLQIEFPCRNQRNLKTCQLFVFVKVRTSQDGGIVGQGSHDPVGKVLEEGINGTHQKVGENGETSLTGASKVNSSTSGCFGAGTSRRGGRVGNAIRVHLRVLKLNNQSENPRKHRCDKYNRPSHKSTLATTHVWIVQNQVSENVGGKHLRSPVKDVAIWISFYSKIYVLEGLGSSVEEEAVQVIKLVRVEKVTHKEHEHESQHVNVGKEL